MLMNALKAYNCYTQSFVVAQEHFQLKMEGRSLTLECLEVVSLLMMFPACPTAPLAPGRLL